MSALDVQIRLRDVVDAAQKNYRTWVNGGITELAPEDDLWKSFSELAAAGKESAGIVGEVFEAAADFWRKWNSFTRAAHASPDDVNIVGADVWTAWERLEDLRTAELFHSAPPLETLAQLERQGVGPNQICAIYGWVDSMGRPMLSRVSEEFAKEPKERVTPKNPLQVRFDREHAERLEKITSYRNRARRKIEVLTKPGPESIEELVSTGVSATQISIIKRISVDQVYKLCEERGLEFPPLDYSGAKSPTRAPGQPAKPQAPAAKAEPAAAAGAKRGPGRPKKIVAPPPKKAPGAKLPPPPTVADTEEDADDAEIPGGGVEPDDVLDESIRTYLSTGYQPAEVVQLMKDNGDPGVNLARVKRVKAAAMATAGDE